MKLRPHRYYLRDGVITPSDEDDLIAWAKWLEDGSHRRIAKYETKKVVQLFTSVEEVDITVSTVFLAIDHNYTWEGPPVLFETMVFGGPYDESMERYETLEEAKRGHERWVAKVNAL